VKRELTCREVADFLLAFLEGELPEGEEATFQEHLEMCPPCQVYLDTYRQTVEVGRRACRDDDEVPGEAPEELISAILAARREPR